MRLPFLAIPIALLLNLALCVCAFALDSTRIDPGTARQKIAAGALLVDVRSTEEFAEGHMDRALNIAHDQVEARINEFGSDKNHEIVLYCASGGRAGRAAEILKRHGFTHVYNAGGLADLAEKPKP